MARVPKARLDILLVNRGLVPSRERARALILAHHVTVNGQVVTKAGTAVAEDAQIDLAVPDHPYVGRGGVKLAHALDVFGVDVRGRHALDVGASTGGFTDVLLQRGALDVIALDVGHGQLDWKLRQDPRVIVREGVNARTLAPGDLPGPVDIISIDVAFISLRLVLPSIVPFLSADGHLVALVKPQFEAGREHVGAGGIVSDPDVHDRVIEEVAVAAVACGLMRAGMTPSPIAGATGNREFFLHLRRQSADTGTPGATPVS